MSARLIILVVVAAILAVRFAMTSSAPPQPAADMELQTFDGVDGKTLEEIRVEQKSLWERDLPGESPEVDPELDIRVEVDTSLGKNRLYLCITEAHGYYMDTFTINIWYTGNGKYNSEDSPLIVSHRIMNRFLKANDTLVDCLEIVPAELSRIDDDIGETGNWDAEIIDWGRAREENPDPLPQVTQYDPCN